jgi:phage terminase large subunit
MTAPPATKCLPRFTKARSAERQFDVFVIPNQGAGAASARIETVRRHFPRIFFNDATTEVGRDALGLYHEKKSNDDRNMGLGPNHDWSLHGADAFGLMCVSTTAGRRSGAA